MSFNLVKIRHFIQSTPQKYKQNPTYRNPQCPYKLLLHLSKNKDEVHVHWGAQRIKGAPSRDRDH